MCRVPPSRWCGCPGGDSEAALVRMGAGRSPSKRRRLFRPGYLAGMGMEFPVGERGGGGLLAATGLQGDVFPLTKMFVMLCGAGLRAAKNCDGEAGNCCGSPRHYGVDDGWEQLGEPRASALGSAGLARRLSSYERSWPLNGAPGTTSPLTGLAAHAPTSVWADVLGAHHAAMTAQAHRILALGEHNQATLEGPDSAPGTNMQRSRPTTKDQDHPAPDRLPERRQMIWILIWCCVRRSFKVRTRSPPTPCQERCGNFLRIPGRSHLYPDRRRPAQRAPPSPIF